MPSEPSKPSKDSKQNATEYFPMSPDVDSISYSGSSENDPEDEKLTKDKEDETLSNSPTAAESEPHSDHRPHAPSSNYARIVAYGLIGMTIHYNGDILDSTKKSFGKASGDITEMVGQKIDEDGLIRDKAGEVVGQVARNYGLEEAVAAMMEAQKAMGGGGSGSGSRESNKTQTEEKRGSEKASTKGKSQELPNIWQGTVGDAPPGNDIHLNVQSTKEGISMSIRIPTLFMKEQHRLFEESKTANKPAE